MADKQAPEALPVSALFTPVRGFNSALDINQPGTDNPSREMPYNQTVDDGLASRRSKQVVRSYEELAAATGPALPLGYGLSLRSAMAGQCENDQFPISTDPFGKQRA